MIFCQSPYFLSENFPKILLGGIRESNSLNPDQVQHFVGSDLGSKCLLNLLRMLVL